MGLSGLDTAKIFKKILLHPGQFVLPRRIYRDCRGLDADGTLVRINELVEEGLGTLIQRTQQQAVFYKALPAFGIEDSLRSHGIAFDEYRKQFFEVDYKVIESQRTAIHNANPDKDLISLLNQGPDVMHERDEEVIVSGNERESNGGDSSGDDGNGNSNGNDDNSDDGSGGDDRDDNDDHDNADDGSGGDNTNDEGNGIVGSNDGSGGASGDDDADSSHNSDDSDDSHDNNHDSDADGSGDRSGDDDSEGNSSDEGNVVDSNDEYSRDSDSDGGSNGDGNGVSGRRHSRNWTK